jgi:hypothetical protein
MRPVIVADDLRTLRGPLTGRWQLPLHVDSAARTVFDFAVERDRQEAYQLVLLEGDVALGRAAVARRRRTDAVVA